MPLIFVSHAASDKEVADHFRKEVGSDFLGMCDIFVSSNLDSLNAGAEWHNSIKNNLRDCAILIGLLSPAALTRGWVYFEFGAGWIRDIPTIPVCHSGLTRDQLPPPISTFQGLDLNDAVHLDHLYALISKAVGCNKPNIDFKRATETYSSISERRRIQGVIVSWTKQLVAWNPNLSSLFDEAVQIADVLVPADLDRPFQEYIHEATARDFLKIERAGMAMGTRVGPQASVFNVSRGSEFDSFAHLFKE